MAKTDWTMDETVMPADMNALGQEINDLQADGSATDDRIGDRTITDETAPKSNTGKLTGLLSGLANMIKSITGGSTWRTAPGMTIAAIKTILDAATNAATANAMVKRDANGRAKVAAPSATDDIARKAEVDAAISTAATDATSKANSAQSAAISTAASDATSKANAAQAAAISAAASDATSKVDAHASDTVKHITASERTTWNAKASTSVATTSANGLMSSSDKTKLDGIASGANNYTHPATHPPSIIAQDTNNRFVTDAEKAAWNGKASSAVATSTSAGLMSSTDKSKLDGIAAGANNYVHPTTHPPSIIAQDANNRFVTDSEKAAWNAKASTSVATTSANGLMSSADKTKLNGIATGANNYVHPSTHPPSIIAQDASNRFVTDAEKAAWNGKFNTTGGTFSGNITVPATTSYTSRLVRNTYISTSTPSGGSNGDIWIQYNP